MTQPTFKHLLPAIALAVAASGALAQDKLTLQLKWVTQAQFAGYYVAKDKGFYKDAGLDVTIKAGGPDINPSQVIAGGGADVIVDWMPSALATREKGVPIVNIAQVFQTSGMQLTCRKDSGIKTPADFKGKTLGVWFFGNEYPFLSWMDKLGLKTRATLARPISPLAIPCRQISRAQSRLASADRRWMASSRKLGRAEQILSSPHSSAAAKTTPP